MQQVAQGWLIYDMTGSALQVGLNGLFRTAPFLVMSLYAGTLVDRLDRKKLLIWSEAAFMAMVALLGVLIATERIEIWHIYASSFILGLISSFEAPARSAILPDLVPRSDLMTALSLNSMVRKGSQIIGPAMGGIFVAAFGIAGAYFIHTGAYVVLLVCLFLLSDQTPVKSRANVNPIQAIVDGLRYVQGERLIAALIIMECTMSLFATYSMMMVVFAKDIYGTGPEGLGLLQSAVGAGSLTASFVLASLGDIRHKGRLLIVSGIAHGAGILGFAFCPWFGLALPILAYMGFTDILFGSTRNTMLQLLIREDMRGRVMSLSAISMRGFGPLGGFQAGLLTTFIGLPVATAIGAVICILVTAGAGAWIPSVRNFEGVGDRRVDRENRREQRGESPAARAEAVAVGESA
jgi:MFS family permease